MSSMKKTNGDGPGVFARDTAVRVGKVAKSAAIAGAKAGAASAIAAGTLEAERVWKETKPPEPRKGARKAAMIALAGAATIGVVAIARSRRKKKA